jgi:hypothetical protein
MRLRAIGTLILACALGTVAPALGQTTPISITTSTVYQPNFDAMGTGASPDYPTGWNGFKFSGNGAMPAGTFVTASTNPAFTTSDGQNNNGTIYNAGTTGSTDRALGSLASGQIAGSFGALFVNNTGVTITANMITIAFRAEQWRRGQTANIEEWAFEYKTGGATLDINETTTTGWTRVSALDMFELSNSGITENTDGNAPGFFQNIGPHPLAGLIWNPGQRLAFRWRDTDDSQSDSLMAIDNLELSINLTAIPEPATLSLFAGVAFAGAFISRRRRPTTEIT